MTASLDAAVASALDELAGVEAARVEMFELRVRRWWPDLHDGLVGGRASATNRVENSTLRTPDVPRLRHHVGIGNGAGEAARH